MAINENLNVTETQQVLIPMIVDRDAFDENGLIAGITNTQIRKWRVCNRVVDVVLVPGTKEQYDAIMADYSRQFKAEDRDKRCAVPGESGKLIRCPECNKCSECPRYLTRDEFGTATFSALATEGDDGEMQDYDPAAPENYNDSDRYLHILADLINHVTEIDPSFGRMIQLLHDGKSRREVAEEMGLPKSTVIDQVAKLKKITEQFLDDLAY